MTLILNLTPEQEARLRDVAAHSGIDAETCALRLLDTALGHGSAGEWEQRLRAFVQSLPRPATPLSDAAARRASFYEDDAA